MVRSEGESSSLNRAWSRGAHSMGSNLQIFESSPRSLGRVYLLKKREAGYEI